MHPIEILTHKISIITLVHLCERFSFLSKNIVTLNDFKDNTCACVIRVCVFLKYAQTQCNSLTFPRQRAQMSHLFCFSLSLSVYCCCGFWSKKEGKRQMSIYHFPIPVSLIACNIRIRTHVLSIEMRYNTQHNTNYTTHTYLT